MNYFDSSSSGTSGNPGTSLSFSHSINAAIKRKLIVGISTEGDNGGNIPITGITFNGNALTKVYGVSTSGVGSEPGKTHSLEYWYYDIPDSLAAGSYTISITYTGSVGARVGGSVCLKNVKRGAPESISQKMSEGDTINDTITTITPGAVVVAIAGSANNSSYTPGSGIIERVDNFEPNGGAQSLTIGTLETTIAGNKPVAFTSTNGGIQGLIAGSFPLSAVGGAGLLIGLI